MPCVKRACGGGKVFYREAGCSKEDLRCKDKDYYHCGYGTGNHTSGFLACVHPSYELFNSSEAHYDELYSYLVE